MTEEEFIKIFAVEDYTHTPWKGCNALQGLKIISKYLPESGITGADHDTIYAAGIDELVKAGITK